MQMAENGERLPRFWNKKEWDTEEPAERGTLSMMEQPLTQDEQAWMQRAVVAKDTRFDGQFVYAVKSTGIFCRPSCAAQPRPENISFFESPSLAQAAGYRACRRCRPQAATAETRAQLVRRLLRLIDEEPARDLDELATELAVSPRHLRRVVQEELGMSPQQLAAEQRLQFSKALLLDTELPVTEVALAAGYGSLRRFHDAFRQKYGISPTVLRSQAESVRETPLHFTLSYRPPLDWAYMLRVFGLHLVHGLEEIDGDAYVRYVHVSGHLARVRVFPAAEIERGIGRLRVETEGLGIADLYPLARRLRRMFDLDANLELIGEQLSETRLFAPLVRRHPGVRLARGWDLFEVVIATVLGQFVSMSHARMLMRQLLEECALEPGLFPSPLRLSEAKLEGLKTTARRKETIREISRRVLSGELSLSEAQSPALLRRQLLAIKGIGPWTAEYIALRALGDPDAFPEKDLVIGRILEQLPELRTAPLSPWRSYATLLLWKEYSDVYTKKNAKPQEPEADSL